MFFKTQYRKYHDGGVLSVYVTKDDLGDGFKYKYNEQGDLTEKTEYKSHKVVKLHIMRRGKEIVYNYDSNGNYLNPIK
jgi:YD repeat-containing protein